MKTTNSQRIRSPWFQGMAAAAIATAFAAFAPVAHAQTGTLSLSNSASCTTFSGFTWNGTTLSVTCASAGPVTPPPPPPCDTTQAGSFGWASATGSATPGNVITGSITRSNGCKGAYTITFGNNAPAGVTVSPATSVTFADGSATAQAVSITTAASTAVGTQIAVWLNGWSSSTGSPAPGIAGTFVGTVTTTPVVTPPPPTGNGSITYSGALTNNLQIVWGTNEAASLPAFKSTDVASYSFTYGGQFGQVVLGAVSNNVAGGVTDTELAISSTAGDFPGQSNCDVRIPASSVQGQGITAISVWTPGRTGPFCLLNVGQTYYLNIRQVSANWASNAGSCTNTNGCALRIQPTGIN